MSFTYRIAVDEAYARTFLKRSAHARSPYLHIGAIAFSLLALVGSVVYIGVQEPAAVPDVLRAMAYIIVPWCILLLVALPLIRARQVKRIVIAAKGGASVSLSEEGIETASQNSESRSAWSAYNHALRYHDGLMLLHMRRLPGLWLPDSSLANASPEEVTSFVAKRPPLKHVV